MLAKEETNSTNQQPTSRLTSHCIELHNIQHPAALFDADKNLLESNRRFDSLCLRHGSLSNVFVRWLATSFPKKAKSRPCAHAAEIQLAKKTFLPVWLPSPNDSGKDLHLLVLQDISSERQALIKAEKATQDKSAFIAALNHEMRSPLGSILAYSQLLNNSEISAEARPKLEGLSIASQHLLSLVNDVLDIAQIEAGRLNITYERVNIRKLLESCLKIVDALRTDRNIALELTVSPTTPSHVLLDPLRIKQILVNLLANAIKFTKQGNIRLTVSCQLQTSQNALLEFSVQDSGIGLTQAQQQNLFKPFGQVHKGERQLGGSGLGLMISRQLLQLMNSDITVTSKPRQGSVFSFALGCELPAPIYNPVGTSCMDCKASICRKTEAQPAAKQLPATEKSWKQPTVLLAEDEALTRLLFCKMLQAELPSVRILSADNGQQAYDIFCLHQPDLILLDVHMPIMSGLEAADLMRQHEKENGIKQPTPIIALTGGCFENEKQACMAAGMDDFLAKPLCCQALQSVLQKYVTAPRISEHLAQ